MKEKIRLDRRTFGGMRDIVASLLHKALFFQERRDIIKQRLIRALRSGRTELSVSGIGSVGHAKFKYPIGTSTASILARGPSPTQCDRAACMAA